jgi:hypothetical protein
MSVAFSKARPLHTSYPVAAILPAFNLFGRLLQQSPVSNDRARDYGGHASNTDAQSISLNTKKTVRGTTTILKFAKPSKMSGKPPAKSQTLPRHNS